MDFQQASDYTNSYRSTRRATDGVRPGFATTYAIGQLIKLAALDSQVYSDGATAIPTTAALGEPSVGVISEDWKGLDGAGALVSGGTLTRGTQTIKATVYGYHPAVLIDNTNAGASATVNQTPLFSSQTAAGKVQGLATTVATLVGKEVGYAMLPAAGIGSSLGGATALVAASTTYTVTGTPTVGDVYSVTLQIPYAGSPSNIISNGVAQTRTVSVTLTAAQAVSVTTAALAVLTAINADSILGVFYIATQVAGAITIKVVPAQFFVTVANSAFQFFYITTAGTVGNSLTVSGAVVGTGTLTAPTSFTSGAGYIGTVPAFIKRL